VFNIVCVCVCVISELCCFVYVLDFVTSLCVFVFFNGCFGVCMSFVLFDFMYVVAFVMCDFVYVVDFVKLRDCMC